MIKRHGEQPIIDYVIVKFSPKVNTLNGRRWGDLLICEHLALETLASNQISAAKTTILEEGGKIFLEVVRFDRVGLRGRRAMATFAAFDGDSGMFDQNWTTFARELDRLGILSGKEIEVVEILDLYS